MGVLWTSGQGLDSKQPQKPVEVLQSLGEASQASGRPARAQGLVRIHLVPAPQKHTCPSPQTLPCEHEASLPSPGRCCNWGPHVGLLSAGPPPGPGAPPWDCSSSPKPCVMWQSLLGICFLSLGLTPCKLPLLSFFHFPKGTIFSSLCSQVSAGGISEGPRVIPGSDRGWYVCSCHCCIQGGLQMSRDRPGHWLGGLHTQEAAGTGLGGAAYILEVK